MTVSRPTLDGILNVLKPVGMTSHDVVDAVRALAGTRRVGHTGTLDPGAAGVLVLAIGRATRLAEFIAAADKEYRVEVEFGRSTDTGDAYGATVSRSDARVDAARLRGVLTEFVGEIEQVPPMVSAVHVSGQRLYALHRRGQQVEVPPRRVTVHAMDLLDLTDTLPQRAWLHVACSKGTYMRGLCRDIGVAVGTGAHASFMVRTRVGRYALEAAYTLEELAGAAATGALAACVDSPDHALEELPVVDLSPPQRQAVLHGQAVPLFKVPQWQRLMQASVVRLRHGEELIALARIEQGLLRPFKVLRDG